MIIVSGYQGDEQSAVAPTEYRTIPEVPGIGVPNNYQAGDDGSIWSSRAGGGTRACNGFRYKRLSGCVGPGGYRCHGVRINGKSYTLMTHKLVLLAFRGPCPDGMECCHNNGVKLDNSIANLRYATHAENIGDKFRHGTMQKGEQIVQSKLTETDIHRIRALVELGAPQKLVAKAFGISNGQMCRIINRQRWSHV